MSYVCIKCGWHEENSHPEQCAVCRAVMIPDAPMVVAMLGAHGVFIGGCLAGGEFGAVVSAASSLARMYRFPNVHRLVITSGEPDHVTLYEESIPSGRVLCDVRDL